MNESNKFHDKIGNPVPGPRRNLLTDAGQYVLSLFNSHTESKLIYHNFQRTAAIVGRIGRLTEQMELNGDIREVAQLAAWFHLTGYLYDYVQAIPRSMDLARGFLSAEQYPANLIEQVVKTIETSSPGGLPETLEEQLLADAIKGQTYALDFWETIPLLRLEWELMQGRKISNYEWNQIQLQELLQLRFYTPVAKMDYGPIAGQHLLMQKSKAEKSKLLPNQLVDEQEGQLRPFQGLEKKVPTSAAKPFFAPITAITSTSAPLPTIRPTS